MWLRILRWRSCCSVAKSCLTLCNPMDCRMPGFPVPGISQARILEWIAISFSRFGANSGIESGFLCCRKSPALQVDSLPTEPTCQCSRCKRHRFDPWVGKIHWSRKWKSTPVFLPGKFQGHDWALTHSPISTKFSKNWKHVCINKISSP